MKKPQYTVFVDGRWFFRTTPEMRAAGIRSQPLGDDEELAFARAEALNAQWKEAKAIAEQDTVKGDFSWLIHEFQSDPTWYGNLKPRTHEEIDYAFRLIGDRFGPLKVRAFLRRHARAFYNDQRKSGSVHKRPARS